MRAVWVDVNALATPMLRRMGGLDVEFCEKEKLVVKAWLDVSERLRSELSE
jgi:hypothetical protein